MYCQHSCPDFFSSVFMFIAIILSFLHNYRFYIYLSFRGRFSMFHEENFQLLKHKCHQLCNIKKKLYNNDIYTDVHFNRTYIYIACYLIIFIVFFL